MGNVVIKDTPYTSQEAGYEAERLEVLNNHFSEMIDKKELISASYCLTHEGKVFVDNALGSLSFEEEDTRVFEPDTIFAIASITKLFTSIAILKLVEDGRLRLDQPVFEILEEFNTPPYNEIQIVHILTHTSGLCADLGAHENKYEIGWWNFLDEAHPKDWITAVLKKGLMNSPGKEWSYSSVGFAILGEIITRISHVHCHTYIEENIVKPCDMTDTSFTIDVKQLDRYNIRSNHTKEMFAAMKEGKLEKNIFEDYIPSTGGGLYSTCRDLSKFGNMIMNYGSYNGKRIIGRKAIEAMRRIHTKPEVQDFCWGAQGNYRSYGLGPDVFNSNNESMLITPGVISHEGFGACSLMIDFEERFVAVWTCQFYDTQWHAHALRNVASIIWSGII